ncbi:unnamed protein product [Lymnaea stagnalis]|uniref:Rho-GAP domain-containing protein n=1 Tax=Lymnaea stagnalis TaxID=6523 RepID=A0AAV2IDZ9_LYMST
MMATLLLCHQWSTSASMRCLSTTAARLRTVTKPSGVDSGRKPWRQGLAGVCQARMFDADVLAGFKLRSWVHSRCPDERLLRGIWSHGGSNVWKYLSQDLGPLTYNYRSLHLTPAYTCNIPVVLPAFIPVADEKLGPTLITDMSQEDQLRIKHLAYEEMKPFLSNNKVKYKSRPTAEIARQVYGGSSMFGTALALLANMDIQAKKINPNFKVPLVFKLFLGHIHLFGHKTQGILQTDGSDDNVLLLKKEIEEKFNVDSMFRISGNYSVHDVSSTFKHFLKELPVPLITTEKIELFPEMFSLDFLEKQMIGMNLYILMMNPEHRDSLEFLLCFMSALTDFVTFNGMDAASLANALAPFVFKVNAGDDRTRLNKLTNALRVMIHYHLLLFYVPPQLIKKLRYQYEKGEPPKPQPGFLFGKKKTKELEPDKKLEKIKVTRLEVRAPDLPIRIKVMKVDEDTKAGDLMKEYISLSSIERRAQSEMVQVRVDMGIDATPLEEFHLYEMNGNIGHRLINPETKILDVYRTNPNGDFVISKRSKLV